MLTGIWISCAGIGLIINTVELERAVQNRILGFYYNNDYYYYYIITDGIRNKTGETERWKISHYI